MLLDSDQTSTQTDLIIPLDHLTPSDAGRVGGKAYNCARLKRAGLPVPDGVAVTVEAMNDAAALSAQLDSALAHFAADTRFAVRSSATDEDSADHSFAGIHDTKLNVAHDGVPDAIRACWASVQSDTALAYRRTQNLPTEDIRTGVLIQVMIQPVVAGVAFTVNPMTGQGDELVINAAWGLGEALVSGQVEPDEFRVNKTDGAMLSMHIGEKRCRVIAEHGVSHLVDTPKAERGRPCLTPQQLRELAALLTRIEHEYGAPQDVEWCHDGHQFWMVQSRPVTATAMAGGPDLEWTRANLREVMPDLPAPQTNRIVCDLLTEGLQRFYGDLLAPFDQLGPMAKVFYGRPYFNFSQLRHLSHRAGLPISVTMNGWGHAEAVRAEDEVAAPRTWHELISGLPDMLRVIGRMMTARRRVHRQFVCVRTSLERLASCQPETLSDAQLYHTVKREGEPLNTSVDIALLLGAGIGNLWQMLTATGTQLGLSVDSLVRTHLASGEKTVSTQQGFDLLALAHTARNDQRVQSYFLNASDTFTFDDYRETLRGTLFLDQFDHFLAQYGHRSTYESDLSVPRYREHPIPLLQAIRGHVHAPTCPSPKAIVAQQECDAKAAHQAFAAQLTPWQRRTVLPYVNWLLRGLKQWFLWRERNRSEAIRVGAAVRRWQLVLAQRFVDRSWIDRRDDYYFLHLDEIEKAIADPERDHQWTSLVARRRTAYAAWQHLQMPLLMRESELPKLLRQTNAAMPAADVKQLYGLGVSAGQTEGEVVVIHSPDDFSRMKPGAILVAQATDPAWTPLFTLASGVVVEIGGMGSHASTVAREYGLPALANVKNATRLLKDGMRVRLDATHGVLDMLSS
ncbi:PEP/pyruvate-binding domain-containing protein [Candidatus Entotheonella palauensis]